MRFILILVALVSLVSACGDRKSIVKIGDYEKYLAEGRIAEESGKIWKEIDFWQQRLVKDTGSYVDMLKLAVNYLHLFRITGDTDALQKGERYLKESSDKLRNTDPELLFRLAQHSITRHQFKQADVYQVLAEKASGDLYTIRLLQFDIYFELGKYDMAYHSLHDIVNRSGFDYLVRKAKWEDHVGNLTGAIQLMEKAFDIVAEKNKTLFCWALSNLGDMYSHAGRVGDAYRAYLRVLETDPTDLYCLKGIAWIAYSHDKNIPEARRIISYILSQKEMPELKLVLAELAAFENDPITENRLLENFVSTVTKPAYGDMYNKYLLKAYTDKLADINKARSIAERELRNRVTPETYDGLAWTLYKNGELTKALELANQFVIGKTFEPEALMHSAFILAACGEKNAAREMLKDCLESEFELGPVTVREIRDKLEAL